MWTTDIKRSKFQVDGNITREEMQRLIREQTGRMDYILSDDEFKKLKIIDHEKQEIAAIMGTRFTELQNLGTKESKGKADELLTVTRFLYKAGLSSSYKVDDLRESPDFILSGPTAQVGLELTQLLDPPLQRELNDLKKALAKTKDLLQQNNPGVTGTFNLTITPGAIKIGGKTLQEINRKNKDQIPEIIAGFIRNFYADQSTPLPAFVTKVLYAENDNIELELAQEYWLMKGKRSRIMEAITEKEDKLNDYRKNTGLKECWLLLVLPGAGEADSFSLDNINLVFTSTYDRVYLVENFTGTIKQLV